MIHPTQKQRLLPLVIIMALVLGSGLAQAATVVLGYGGTTSTNGAGVYPQHATANSDRYFRCILSIADTEVLTRLWVSGSINGPTTLFPKPNGNWNDATDGVTRYLISSGSTSIWAYTIGPFVGRDIFGAQHCPTESLGVLNGTVGDYDHPFTFYATTVPAAGGTATTVASGTGSYRTQNDNCAILDWWSGSAAGVDPLSVDGAVPGADAGSSSNTYTFRVQYRILPENGVNLLPRFGTQSQPPGPYGNFANWDRGRANAQVHGDWSDDWWTYSGGLTGGQVPAYDYSNQYPRYDDMGDTSGYWRAGIFPEVVLIIDGDVTRPKMMLREDTSDDNARDANGIRYFYKLLPTDYQNFMDNLFLFPYDPPGPDPQDDYAQGLHGRPVSNNYVGMQVGNHTYEFFASADFSPPDGNRVWLQVGRPGDGEYNYYMKPILGGGGQMQLDQVVRRFNDRAVDPTALDPDGGYGYPFDSQSGQYPLVNPMLTAHPYFPRGTIAPNAVGSALSVNPPGAAANPFAPEPDVDGRGNIIAGPNPPLRVTNDDTILPNFVNIRPDTDPDAPFRGGKWTSSSTFKFRINYWESKNVPPEYIRLQVRKSAPGGTPGAWRGYTMEKATPADSTYTDGCVYQYVITPDQLPDGGGPGDYNYYFVASDGTGQAIFPNRPGRDEAARVYLTDPSDMGVPVATDGSNDYYSFRVNRAPSLSAQAVTPGLGSGGSDFQFTVTYTDPDGELLNASSLGDRPFETSIWVDLFGSYLGQASVVSVQNATTLNYKTSSNNGYAVNELAGMVLEMQTGTAATTNPPKRYLIVSNTATQIVLDANIADNPTPPIVTCNNANLTGDGVAANNRFRVANWFHGTMSPADASDTNYKDGKVYVYNSATHVVLGPGVHRYYFEFVDDWGSWLFPSDSNVRVEGEKVRFPFTGEFEGPEVLPNTPPQLKDFRFTPKALSGADGTTATPFVFSVTYVDDENNPPASIRLGVDGTADAPELILNMSKSKADDVYTDGVVYVTPPVKLTEGRHIFRAQASDGSGRFPNTPADQPFVFSGPHNPDNDFNAPLLDSVDGPLVAANTPPTLTFPSADANTADPNNPPGLEPNAGRQTTEFTYTIIYTDVDRFASVAGNPPDDSQGQGGYINLYIDNGTTPYPMTKVNPADNDYTDGVTYEFKISGLAEGSPHTYVFVASDGLDRARRPVMGAIPSRYNGPKVDEPPGEPQSLVASDTANDNGKSIDLRFNPSQDENGGADDVIEYRVYRSTTSGSYTEPPVLVIPATTAPAYNEQDLTAQTGVPYYYIVRAYDGASESIDSNEAGPIMALDNIPPQPPTNVTANDPGLGGTVNVAWNVSPDDGGGQGDVTNYHIYRATTPAGFGGAPVGTVGSGVTSFADTTVADNTQYYYMVRAFDGANESDDSNVAGPVQSTDQQPPIIDNLFPVHRAVDVPLNTQISFWVSDTGTGVDQSTIAMTVNGTAIPTGSLTITGTPARYTVTYQPGFTEADYRKVITVTAQASDLGGQPSPLKTWKFTLAGPQTFSIAGTVLDQDSNPKQGVVVSSGDLQATTDAAGNYVITGLVQGTYVVRPALRGFTFSPSTRTVDVDTDVTGVDFTWAPGYDIAGKVLDGKGNGMQGVSVTNGLTNTVTDETGYFRMRDLPAGTYNLVPSLPRYVFEPQSLVVQVGPGLSGLGQRFVGRLQTFGVSGVITDVDGRRLDAVAVDATSSEGNAQAITNVSGQYNLANLRPGTWTLTPRKANYMFKPQSETLDVDGNISEVNFIGLPIYNMALPAGMSFISLPIEPDDPNPLAVFGNPAQVGFFRYNPAISAYPPSNGGWEGLNVRPGRGFWVRPNVPTVLAVPGTPVPANRAVQLQLDASGNGWNMVGNPYDAALPWSNVGVTAGSTVRDFAYIWDQANGYRLVTDLPGVGGLTTIPRHAGFWMRALSTQSVPVSPVSATAASRHQVWTRAAGEFVVPIVAEAGQLTDTTARAGVVGYAASNPSAYQIENPPVRDRYVDVYFTGQGGQMLTCDIRGEAGSKVDFAFAVKTSLKNTVVKLSLPDLSQVPRDKSVVLVDVAAGKRIYARTMNTYSYNSGDGGARQFRLEVASAAGGGLSVTTAPASAKGGAVSLTYTLSQPATVELTVLNLAGRTVRVLNSGATGTAGVNTTAWDLRSQSGSRVPSGRYLLRVQAASEDGQQVTAVAPLNVP